jgi:hypothetical protein
VHSSTKPHKKVSQLASTCQLASPRQLLSLVDLPVRFLKTVSTCLSTCKTYIHAQHLCCTTLCWSWINVHRTYKVLQKRTCWLTTWFYFGQSHTLVTRESNWQWWKHHLVITSYNKKQQSISETESRLSCQTN